VTDYTKEFYRLTGSYYLTGDVTFLKVRGDVMRDAGCDEDFIDCSDMRSINRRCDLRCAESRDKEARIYFDLAEKTNCEGVCDDDDL
jgi:hypothetical protein